MNIYYLIAANRHLISNCRQRNTNINASVTKFESKQTVLVIPLESEHTKVRFIKSKFELVQSEVSFQQSNHCIQLPHGKGKYYADWKENHVSRALDDDIVYQRCELEPE